MLSYTRVNSPAGILLLAADDLGLRKLIFKCEPKPAWREDPDALRPFVNQVLRYFAGELREFSLPLAPEGTAFQQRVWQELRTIPYGQTISYGELARRIGKPSASRAVGLANG